MTLGTVRTSEEIAQTLYFSLNNWCHAFQNGLGKRSCRYGKLAGGVIVLAFQRVVGVSQAFYVAEAGDCSILGGCVLYSPAWAPLQQEELWCHPRDGPYYITLDLEFSRP